MEHVFVCKDVAKQYSAVGFQLKPLSLSLKPGKITGVVGENGNGKTTLLRIIAGDLAHDSGTLTYFNNEVELINWNEVKSKVAYIPQRIPRWYGALRDNLIFEAAIRGIKGNFTEQQLASLFPDATLHQSGKTFLVELPLSVSAKQFLETLLTNNFEIVYFRDISSSSQKLFQA